MRLKFLEVCGCFLAGAISARAVTPSILSPPQSITVNNASDAAFSVVATNAARYQWQFQGADLAGATNATLSLEDVQTNQAGAYTVVVSSSDGVSVTNTPPAALTVVPGTIVRFTISSFPGGAGSNLVVQLFDHDKPATVQNFLHYIVGGAYTNVFFDRCVPGFVLQGGDYATDDRTNASLLPYSIYEDYTVNLAYSSPPYTWQVDNEFDVGPLIHNKFGTLVMAKQAGNPDSAANAFFFNLADNSANLDNQNGGFTVFGRVLEGSNVLEYFNGLSKPDHGINDSGVSPLTDLPVNYSGPALPGDSNLFYLDFAFPGAQPVMDTNPPTASLAYPTNGATTTNASLVVRGTASDNVGLARVICNFFDSNGFDNGVFGGSALGTTNWSYAAGNLPPGAYTESIVSQDGAGNLSSNMEITFTVPRFPFSAVVNGPGTLSTNLDGINSTIGSTYKIKAIPASGAEFVGWTIGTSTFLNPEYSFVMANGLQFTANFVSNVIPGGISFTGPSPNAKLTNPVVTVKGKIGPKMGSATVTCQFFSYPKSTAISVTGPMVVSGTDTWSLAPVPFEPGQYLVQAVARDASGGSSVISEEFTVLSPLTVLTNGSGKTSLANGAYLETGKAYTITATPAKGSSFYEWADGTGIWNTPTHKFTNSAGLALLATFVKNGLPNSISITSPTSQVLTDNFVIGGTLASVVDPQVTCQLFLNHAAYGAAHVAAISGTTWSVAVSNLQQGTYTATAIVTDSEGKQGSVSKTFTVNFYPNIAGTYYGLFLPPTAEIDVATSGRFVLTVTRTGAFSTRVILPSRTFAVSGSLGTYGSFAWYAQGFDGTYLYSGLEVDLTGGTGKVSGYVYSLGVYASMLGYRATTNLTPATVPETGDYIFDFQTITNYEAGGPTNDGFATLSVAGTGVLKLGGTLADNTAFSQTTGVSKDGVWPVFASLYGGRGMLIGWETNQTGGGAAGALYWIKPKSADYYDTNNVVLLGSFSGTNYLPPGSGTAYQIVFSGDVINQAVTIPMSVNGAGQFVPAAVGGDNLKITLSTAGALTGQFSDPTTGKIFHFKGVFTSPSLGGAGFILNTGKQTGIFNISQVP